MPETWFFYKAIVLPLSKKWRLGRETSYSNSIEAISRAYFPYFLKSLLPASHPFPGRTLQNLEGAGRHVGSVRVPRLGGQRSPQPPSCGPQELGGPRGSLENRTSPSAFLQALARREGGRAPQRSSPDSPRPPAPLPSGCTAQESTQNAAQSSLAPRRPGESILRGSFPLQLASDIPTPT